MAKPKVEQPKERAHKTSKKQYMPPSLTEYGTIAKVTQASPTGSTGDGGVHPNNRRP